MKEFIYKLIPDYLKINYYKIRGKRPWSAGYTTFKFKYIKEAIYNQEVLEKFKNLESLPEGYGYSLDERAIEYPWVLSRIPLNNNNFMDAGSALNIKEILEHPIFNNKKITILNLNPELNCFWQKGISYVFDDIRNMPFKDNYFDLITCVSTLEHIGMDNTSYVKNEKYKEQNTSDFEKAMLELKRVLKLKGKVLITVPFGKYQNFGWFQQFDFNFVKKALEIFQPSDQKISYYKYEKGWNISTETSCRDVEYLTLPKLNSGSAQAIACLELIK